MTLTRPSQPLSKLKRTRLRFGADRRWIVCDPENPDALIYMVWPEFAKAIITLDRELPKVWSIGEHKLLQWVKPTKLLDHIRHAFWARVYDCRQHHISVRKSEVLAGLASNFTWENIISHQANLAYVVRPIPRIEAAHEALIWRALRKVIEIVDAPLDIKSLGVPEQKSYLSMMFQLISECEQRLHPELVQHRDQLLRNHRKQRIEEMKDEKIKLNIEDPVDNPFQLEGFDLNELPEDDLELEGELDGQDPGDESHGVSEEGSPSSDTKAEDF